MSGRLFVGTSGFAYKEWKGDFYPEGTKDKEMLAYYSTVLSSVEINYTFRRMPAETTCNGWREQAADGFLITLKASQRITHYKRLIEVGEDVDEFVRLARLLGDKLGTILFQLPPNFAYNRDVLRGFLATLSPVARYAMEFRHDSWKDSEVTEALSEAGVAVCAAETEDKTLEEIPVIAPHAYLRLRKEEYSSEELSNWARRIAPLLEKGTDVFCYFKHEGGGVGPAYALALEREVKG